MANANPSNQAVFAMLPPIDDDMRSWAERLRADVPGFDVVLAEDEDSAKAVIARADAAYGWVSPEQLPSASNLRWLQNPFAGPFPGYYYQGLIDHPVTITNPPGIYSDQTCPPHRDVPASALSAACVFGCRQQSRDSGSRGCAKHVYYVRGPTWRPTRAHQRGWGGTGSEGRRLVPGRSAHNVVGNRSRPEPTPPLRSTPAVGPRPVAARTRIRITTVPHTPETEFMWNAERFRLMKRSAYFINIGRGMTAKLDDLTAALATGEIAGAGLDVFEIEPLPAEHPLWRQDNVLITPHVAVADAEDIPERRYALLADNARRFLAGEELRNVVDKARWY